MEPVTGALEYSVFRKRQAEFPSHLTVAASGSTDKLDA